MTSSVPVSRDKACCRRLVRRLILGMRGSYVMLLLLLLLWGRKEGYRIVKARSSPGRNWDTSERDGMYSLSFLSDIALLF